MNMPLVLLNRRRRAGGFSPYVALFANNEPGIALDPNDAANLSWRRNLLTWTEQFDNAAWGKTAAGVAIAPTVTANAGIAPDGTTTADRIQFDCTNTGSSANRSSVTQNFTATTGVSYTSSIYIRAFDAGNVGRTVRITSDFIGTTVYTLTADWQRVVIGGTSSGTGSNLVIETRGTFTQQTADILLWGAQLEVGSAATTYQRITDVNAETVALFPNATLFQDTAATIPVTTPGQSVALALDKSRGLVPGNELAVNGDFASGLTGWTAASTGTGSATAPSGALVVSGTGASNRGIISQSITTVAGRTYAITFAVISATGAGSAVIAASTTSGATFNLGFTDSNATARRLLFVASGATSSVNIYTSGSATVTIDNISVRELPGNHATQATAGSRPLYALLPANGVRNLANGSADVGNATYWGTSATVNGITYTRVASGLDTDGLPYADYTVTGTATALTDLATYTTAQSRSAMVVGQTLCTSIRAQIIAGTAPPANCGVIVRVVAENSSLVAVETFSSTVSAPATETTLSISGAITNATTAFARCAAVITTASGATVNYTVRIKALQFELGSTRTAYQFNYSNVNIAQPPFAQVGALLFDGVDDFLQTPSIDFAGYEQLGSELVTNGDFSGGTTTGWTPLAATLSVVSGAMRVTATTSGLGAVAYTSVPTVAGRSYKFTATLVADAATGNTFMYAGTTAGAGDNLNANIGSTLGTYSYVFTATGATTFISVSTSTAVIAAETIDFDNISVREVLRPADKMTVFAGVRKVDSAGLTIVELGPIVDTTNGSFALYANAPGGPNIFQLRSRGTSLVPANLTVNAPVTGVVTGIMDISGKQNTIRVNGVSVQNTADQGTGNYRNDILYIGRRAGTSFPFIGYLHSLIVRGAATDTATIQLVERWVNSRTGAY